MALETGTYISDLVATNPLGSDPKSQGDDHLRLIKKMIKNTFPNIAGEVDATHTALSAANKGKNKIINGDFSVWQRGTSFAAIASGSYSADRWVYGAVGTAVHTISRSTDVPTVAEAGHLINYSMLVDCTTADAAIAAGDNARIIQHIEGFNFASIAQKSFTLSFWVKATKTGIYCISVKNSGGDRSYVAEYTVNTTNTWEKKTITVSASPSAGTWNYGNGVGLSLLFTLAAGSTFQTAADVWQTGDFYATANQVNALDSTANNFQITDVQIEKGVDATEFEQLSYDRVLNDCYRYYEKIGTGFGGRWFNTTTCSCFGSFITEKRTNPTVTLLQSNPSIYELGSALRVGSGSVLSGSVTSIKGVVKIDISGFTGVTIGSIASVAGEYFAADAEL